MMSIRASRPGESLPEAMGRTRAVSDLPLEQPHTTGATDGDVVLRIRNLQVEFPTKRGLAKAVRGLDLDLRRGQALGLVGESGCGKSVALSAILGMVRSPGRVTGGSIEVNGQDIVKMSPASVRAIRGRVVSMILQDPLTSLDPLFQAGYQISEALPRGMGSTKAGQRVRELLRAVRISDPERRIAAYPHQLSGGMRQRIVAAIGLASEPTILLADEPTTALDSTIQVQFLSMLKEVQRENGLAMILVTHDLGVVRRACEQVAVMYAGRAIERGPTETIFHSPHHPYTSGLIRSIPDVGELQDRLPAIDGQPPDPAAIPSGCPFRPRCSFAMDICASEYPPIREAGPGHSYACWLEPSEAAEKLRNHRRAARPHPAMAGESR